uniref:PDEase domain-containing protein n=1 Tax=Macrostomum lignano TaxID=282301 RepID=A0A1I8JNN7_9PLAT
TFDCQNLLCVMNDDQPMREPRSMLRVCLWEEELRELGGQSLVVTPFHFSESTVRISFSFSFIELNEEQLILSVIGSAAFPAAEADAASVAGGAPDRSAPPFLLGDWCTAAGLALRLAVGIWTLSAAVSLVAAPPVERSSYIFFQFLWLTPAALVLLMLALSVTFYRRFVGDPNVENDHPDGARKFLVLHKASRECLDKQAVETVCRTLEEMVSDSMKGLSSMEIWAYEVVHLQKLRELGYKLLEFLDDLKRDTRDSHNLAPTQVLTDVAMTLVLEREVRCLTNRDKEVPVHAFSAFSQSVADQEFSSPWHRCQPDSPMLDRLGTQNDMASITLAANTQLLSWARHIRKYQRAFLGEHLEQSLAYPCGQVGHAVNHGQ